MKFKIVILILIFSSFSIFAQESRIPQSLKDSFNKLHPNATEIKWSKGKNEIEVNFKENKKNQSCSFNKNGELLETESEINKEELPKEAEKYISDKYSGYTISAVAKITDNKGIVTYEAEIQKNKVKKELFFDQTGKPLKTKK